MFKTFISSALLCACSLPITNAQAEEPAAPAETSTELTENITSFGWDIRLKDMFGGKDDSRSDFSIYARSDEGRWVSALGTSRKVIKGKSRRTYNSSWQHVDLSQVHLVDGVMKGQITVHMTPDLWIPASGKSFPIVIDIDAKLDDNGNLTGTYLAHKPEIDEPTIANFKFGTPGQITSSKSTEPANPIPTEGTLKLDLHSTLVGGLPDYKIRTLVVYLGYKQQADGSVEIVKSSFGTLPRKGDVTARAELDPKLQNMTRFGADGFSAQLTIPTMTLDMLPCTYHIEVNGTIHNGVPTGLSSIRVDMPNNESVNKHSSFDGYLHGGINTQHYRGVVVDDWFKPVSDHKPVAAGEHPRLLFRRSDIPALRERAKTPEGQAIIKRLRYQLNAGDGRTPAIVYSDYTHAYMGGGYRSHNMSDPGVYTFSHVVGYGLLYQLTGEQLYADLGKEAMERALAGQRDRDDRYSFVNPGGALRAGPVLGWTAVGYDLCYDGWDPEFRAKITKEIAEYTFSEGRYSLDSLVRATKPPGSNHFGMQVGGATLALLAIDQEPDINQEQIDTWLRVAKHSTIRNVSEGFGDGGVFAEGDGTGSMATYISYLSSLQAWRNVKGLDMIDNGRSEVPMMTLKWLYLSRVNQDAVLEKMAKTQEKFDRHGKGRKVAWDRRWVNFPQRGEYPHNIWARGGLSGAGYFAHGFGCLLPEQQQAMKWFYQQHFAAIDDALEQPLDTVSIYPHVSVSSFVNWPIEQEAVNPAELLPKFYIDSESGFIAGRDRWQDANDFIISIQLNSVTNGYMRVKKDRILRILGGPFADLSAGQGLKQMQISDSGDQAQLQFNNADQSLLADLSGKSGERVVLATTLVKPIPKKKRKSNIDTSAAMRALSSEIKVGDTLVRLVFPGSESVPQVTSTGNKVQIGELTIVVEGNNLSFAD